MLNTNIKTSQTSPSIPLENEPMLYFHTQSSEEEMVPQVQKEIACTEAKNMDITKKVPNKFLANRKVQVVTEVIKNFCQKAFNKVLKPVSKHISIFAADISIILMSDVILTKAAGICIGKSYQTLHTKLSEKLDSALATIANNFIIMANKKK